ncbi:MAG: two-component regulator propeller domain-containing protein [Prevotella sp.]|jgi:signal transduction histidine kinase/ligand-binding sensor domain-containing protein/DNA-binding response OmpR family regulator
MKIRTLFLLLCALLAMPSWCQNTSLKFFHIGYRQGLSDNQVNCIYKSSSGFLWVGTSLGLNRYDGFHIRTFYSIPGNPKSLPENTVNDICEDAEGKLWVMTTTRYSIYDPLTESFDNDTKGWMSNHGMEGDALNVCSDAKRNLWIASSNHTLYYYDFTSGKSTTVARNYWIEGTGVSNLRAYGRLLMFNYSNGLLRVFDHSNKKFLDFTYMQQLAKSKKDYYKTFIDTKGNYWMFSSDLLAVGYQGGRNWKTISGYVVRDVAEDKSGNILLATDHDGLVIVDRQGNMLSQWLHSPTDPMSLPDNTLQRVYVDNLGIVWVGTYRLGIASCFSSRRLIDLLPLGDIYSMCEDQAGWLWMGTNDKGICSYNLATRQLKRYTKAQTGLGSDIIVSTLAAKDGSLWFGTFRGGIAHYQNGRFTSYRQSPNGLAVDDVWSLCELPDGRIAIGTLGGGLQLLDPKTNQFTTYNTHNSKLPSDYLASVVSDGKGNLILAHSGSVSIFNIKSEKFTLLSESNRKDVRKDLSGLVNQVLYDSRHLIWIATANGLSVYDPSSKLTYEVPVQGLHDYIEVSAIAEDHSGRIWATTVDGLKCISLHHTEGEWKFLVYAYGEFDGVQSRLFNKRSMVCLRDGRVLAGGIDGVNVIGNIKPNPLVSHGRVIFSDLALFDHTIGVGEKFNGHVVLKQSINMSHRLDLRYDENNFVIYLSTNLVGLPEKPRFLYRLKGLNDRWMTTAEAQGVVKFTNLSPGHYTLEVRLIDGNGNALPEVATLKIQVHPPFYLSVWAWLIYILLLVLAVYYAYTVYKRKRKAERERMEFQKQKEIDEMKLVFFTNVSHELRTPLTLILSPLPGIIEKETDSEIVRKLKLIQRNAHKMLGMVNDILDLRRMLKNKDALRLQRGNIVACVRGVCDQFIGLTDKDVTLTFMSDAEDVTMSYDQDKINKIVANLLSNAFKFVPEHGRIDVKTSVVEEKTLEISVADNGPGISDEEKKHLFERFYQSKDNIRGGTGIGLNLVANYAQMHGGMVRVEDNPKGGTVMVVSLPIGDGTVSGKAFVQAKSSKSNTEPTSEEKQEEQFRYTVLIVDDNPDFIEFMRSEFKYDYRVITASNGHEALSLVDEDRPDIILTDVMMPVMDGNELCRRVKQNESTKDIPVVMLTARLSEENEKESRDCGADDYIKKPFNLELLKDHVKKLLKQGTLGTDGKVEPHITEEKITSVDEQFVSEVTSYIEKHLPDTSLTVESMSKDLGMSRVNLYRRLIAVTGKTPSEFIRLIRLRHAEKLVIKSQLTVAEIGYKVGFASPRYFSKCYKELFGYLPSQYKRGEE